MRPHIPAARDRGAGRPAWMAPVLALAALAAAGAGARPLPPIVFVSRAAPSGRPGVVPGIGPAGRALATRGRLLVRERDGRVRGLVAPDSLWDVARPAVSPDARTVAFAGVRRAGDPWRLWRVGIDGTGLALLSPPERSAPLPAPFDDPRLARFDDLDPCWIDDATLVFASTRWPQVSAYDGRPVTNLWVLRLDRPDSTWLLTRERNGAEAPAWDARRGRVLFARWWFNRHRAPGAARDSAGAALDSANVWQAMEVRPDGTGLQVAAGDFRSRLGSMAYQPAVLSDGSIAAVYAANTGLSPASGPTGIQRFAPRLGSHRRLAGALLAETPEDPYASPARLAAPSACAPAALPDGRIVFAFDPGGRGDFGLWVMDRDGARREPLLDLPGTLELDPAPVVARAQPRLRSPAPPPAPPTPADDLARFADLRGTFRYHDLDVFAPPGSAPAPRAGARLRFYAALARPAAPGGDTAVLVREVPVPASGEVDARGLPAGVPMFEDLVDPSGRALRGPRGLAHVAGLNVGDPRTPSTCVGCHRGHASLVRDGRPAPGLIRPAR